VYKQSHGERNNFIVAISRGVTTMGIRVTLSRQRRSNLNTKTMQLMWLEF